MNTLTCAPHGLAVAGLTAIALLAAPSTPATIIHPDDSGDMSYDGASAWSELATCSSGCESDTNGAWPAALTIGVSDPGTTASLMIRSGYRFDRDALNGSTELQSSDVRATTPKRIPLPPSLPLLASALTALTMLWARCRSAQTAGG